MGSLTKFAQIAGRTCSKCGALKAEADYYQDRGDGLPNTKCKACCIAHTNVIGRRQRAKDTAFVDLVCERYSEESNPITEKAFRRGVRAAIRAMRKKTVARVLQ